MSRTMKILTPYVDYQKKKRKQSNYNILKCAKQDELQNSLQKGKGIQKSYREERQERKDLAFKDILKNY